MIDRKGHAHGYVERIAGLISHILNPAGVALIVWVGWWIGHPGDGLVVLVGVLFYAVLPALSILNMVRTGAMDTLYPTVRAQRNGLLLVGALSYGVGVGVLWTMGADRLLLAAGMSFTVATLLVYCINLRWKISIHCVGVGGAVGLGILAWGIDRAWLGLLAVLLVAWSRLYVRAHTRLQVVAGLGLGIAVSAAAYWAIGPDQVK